MQNMWPIPKRSSSDRSLNIVLPSLMIAVNRRETCLHIGIGLHYSWAQLTPRAQADNYLWSPFFHPQWEKEWWKRKRKKNIWIRKCNTSSFRRIPAITTRPNDRIASKPGKVGPMCNIIYSSPFCSTLEFFLVDVLINIKIEIRNPFLLVVPVSCLQVEMISQFKDVVHHFLSCFFFHFGKLNCSRSVFWIGHHRL